MAINKHVTLSLALMLTLGCVAQSIPIQLMVVDQDGFEKVNTPVKLRLTMRNDTLSTTGQYVEVHTTTTNDLGIVSIQFGEGIPTSNTKVLGLDGFTFSQSEPYIRTELDTTISPSSYVPLGWMKYSYPVVAQRALKADTADYLRNSLIYETNDAAFFTVGRGITIPSIDSVEMNNISSPITGQLIYNSNLEGLLIWSSNQWKPINIGGGGDVDVKRVRNSLILN